MTLLATETCDAIVSRFGIDFVKVPSIQKQAHVYTASNTSAETSAHYKSSYNNSSTIS